MLRMVVMFKAVVLSALASRRADGEALHKSPSPGSTSLQQDSYHVEASEDVKERDNSLK